MKYILAPELQVPSTSKIKLTFSPTFTSLLFNPTFVKNSILSLATALLAVALLAVALLAVALLGVAITT